MTSLPDVLKGARFAIELGRWLVGEAGVHLTRVIDRKESRGEAFLVVDGGLHHQLAASGNFGTVVKRNYPVAVATAGGKTRPCETGSVWSGACARRSTGWRTACPCPRHIRGTLSPCSWQGLMACRRARPLSSDTRFRPRFSSRLGWDLGPITNAIFTSSAP